MRIPTVLAEALYFDILPIVEESERGDDVSAEDAAQAKAWLDALGVEWKKPVEISVTPGMAAFILSYGWQSDILDNITQKDDSPVLKRQATMLRTVLESLAPNAQPQAYTP